MRKFLISSAVAATMLATSGVAQVATDGTGQFLIAPSYFADSGFSTKLKLVNTSLNKSYLYRVTVREYVSSEEFDFIVTLSPSDVWDATIYKDGDDYWIKSDDDSNYGTTKGFTKNITKHFNANKASGKADRSFKRGYVEFYPIAMYRETAENVVSGVVSKSTLDSRFLALSKGLPSTYTTPGIDDLGTSPKGPRFVERDGSVAGFVTVMKDEWKAAMTIPMTALENVIDPSSRPLTGNVPNGNNIGFGTDAVPAYYLGETGAREVARNLQTVNVTVPFESQGKNDALYMTFWNDGYGGSVAESKQCFQVRKYSVATRDMKEGRGKDKISMFSPENDPDLLIRCEMNGIIVSSALDATDFANTEKGMIQLYGLQNQHITTTNFRPESTQVRDGNPSVIATYMSAVKVDGSPSFSWTYAPVRQLRGYMSSFADFNASSE